MMETDDGTHTPRNRRESARSPHATPIAGFFFDGTQTHVEAKMKHSGKIDGRPSFQFYPDDWLSDLSLSQCTMAAQGLWMHMICRMWTSPRRGHLLKANGSRAEAKHVAKWAAISEAEAKQLLSELQAEGVCSTDDSGVIYSRRMARDEKQRQSKVEAGRKGGKISKRKAEPKAKRGSSTSTPSPTPASAPNLRGTMSAADSAEAATQAPRRPLKKTGIVDLQKLADSMGGD